MMWFSVLFLFGSALGSELIWSACPSSLVITDSNVKGDLGDIQNLVSAVHGFTTHADIGFGGVFLSNPFDVPRATVLITLYGAGKDGSTIPGKHFILNDDGSHTSLHSLEHHARHIYGKEANIVELELNSKVSDFDGILNKLSLSADEVDKSLSGVSMNGVNASIPEVTKMLDQSSLLLQTIKLLDGESSKILDVIHVEIEIPGKDSLSHENARTFITTLLSKVQEMAVKSYEGQANVIVVSLQSLNKHRRTRNILQVQEPAADNTPGNVMQPYKEWNEDSPAVFNIILWTSIGLALLVILVAYGMANTDPGHDSIIYRMTTSRLKRD